MSDQLVAEAATCTMQSQETNIHALSGILTGNPSNQADSDLRLRKHFLQDWLNVLWALKWARRMRLAEHVARMGEGRGVYRVLVGKP